MDNKEIEEETIKSKAKMYSLIVFSIIVIIIIFILVFIFSIKSAFNSFSQKTYYILDVTSENKNKIIELFEKEKENIFYDKNFCDSIYRIEYYHTFHDGTSYTMYCKDEDNIIFNIDKAEEDTLANYIYKNGFTEKR